MRIVQLVETLEIGGLERLAVDLATAEQAAGHSSSIYCLLRRGDLAAQAEATGIEVVDLAKKPGRFSAAVVWKMAQQLRRDRPDILHTHNAVIHHYGVAAARLAGVPVVVNTRHGLNLVPPNLKAERIFRALLRWTDRVVLVSQDGREFFVQQRGIPRKKTEVILNGIPVEKFAACRARPGARRPALRFGTAARMVAAKDHATLVEAFALTPPPAELHFLGDGPLRPELEQRISRLGLGQRVTLHGAGFRVAEFLGSMDVFVLSSVTEGLPVSLLEAMAAGLPIVSTRVGGIPEVAPEGRVAWFCPPGDPAALAECLRQAAAAPDLAERGAEALRLASGFSITQMANNYLALFERLLTIPASASAT